MTKRRLSRIIANSWYIRFSPWPRPHLLGSVHLCELPRRALPGSIERPSRPLRTASEFSPCLNRTSPESIPTYETQNTHTAGRASKPSEAARLNKGPSEFLLELKEKLANP
jgi:hypothetical protein